MIKFDSYQICICRVCEWRENRNSQSFIIVIFKKFGILLLINSSINIVVHFVFSLAAYFDNTITYLTQYTNLLIIIWMKRSSAVTEL